MPKQYINESLSREEVPLLAEVSYNATTMIKE
jgi:hypothetical protein